MRTTRTTQIVYGLAAIAVVALVLWGMRDMSAPERQTSRNAEKSSSSEPLPDQALSKAGYTFPVNNIRLSGNQVSFTIAENAREYDKKADAVVLSGMYAGDKGHSDTCPVVDSHFVDKEVEHYSPTSGKADVIATFDDASVARAAVEKGCLLIQDNG